MDRSLNIPPEEAMNSSLAGSGSWLRIEMVCRVTQLAGRDETARFDVGRVEATLEPHLHGDIRAAATSAASTTESARVGASGFSQKVGSWWARAARTSSG